MTVENAQQFVTWHPRCGTSFLLVVMVIAMVVYAFLPFDSFAAKFVARIALLPVIVGVSYELIRFAAKRRQGLMAVLTQPGLWLQRITTQPPSNEQAEVAIHALESCDGARKSAGRRTGHRVNASIADTRLSMQYQERLDEAEARFNELTAQMADPARDQRFGAVPQSLPKPSRS